MKKTFIVLEILFVFFLLNLILPLFSYARNNNNIYEKRQNNYMAEDIEDYNNEYNKVSNNVSSNNSAQIDNSTFNYEKKTNEEINKNITNDTREENENEVQNQNIKNNENFNKDDSKILRDNPIIEGIYEIHSSLDDNKLVDVEGQSCDSGANIYIYQRSNVQNQKFKFIYNSDDGTYTIISINSNKAMDVQNGGTTNGTNVWQFEQNGTDSQKWIAIKNNDGTYSFMSKLKENLYLDISGGVSNNCTNVQVYEGNSTKSQKFRLVLQYDFQVETDILEDTYNILISENKNMGLDINNCSQESMANVQIWTIDNNPAQKYKLLKNNDKTYMIMAVNSGKVLDVSNGNMTNCTNVWQYDVNETDSQKWYIVKNNDNTYSFISKLNGLALDISGGVFSNGTNVQVYEYNNTSAQKFILKKAYPMSGEKTIEDGVYELSAKGNINESIDIFNGSKDENIQIQLWESNFTDSQKFLIKYVGNGYYKIISKVSGKALTVENTSPQKGSSIVQRKDENLDTQKWIIKKNDINTYYIYSKCGNLCIDVPNGDTTKGTKLQLWSENGTSSQKFIFIKREVKGQKTIEDGIYKINLKNNKVFDIDGGKFSTGANLQTWANSNVQQQKFRVKYNDDGTYTIIAIHSAKALDVQNGGTSVYTNVWQYDINGTINQKWIIQDVGNGYYNIISQANGLYVDISGGLSNNDGTNIQLFYDNGTDAQQFKFTPINIIDEDSYQIQSTINSRKVLDVSGGSQDNYANIQLWDYSRVPQQSFKFQAISNEEYTIIADHSNKALDVQNGGTEPGTNVDQYEQNGTENQKWIIQEAGNDSYYIISAANGLCLDAKNGEANNGTNIQIYTPNNTNAQKFKITHSNEIVIVLNPGHGGYETGCANNGKGLVEKNVTLQIARYIRDELSGIPDVQVILTRDGDYQMNLDTRAMIARNNNADLYVSLHINDESSHSVRGSQMYVPFYEGQSHYNSEMTRLANLIQEELSYIGIGRNISGGIVKRNIDQIPKYQYLLNGQVVQADYYADIRHAMKGDTLDYGPDLNTETGVPAILVEHCFMNSSDSNYLDSDYDLRRVAQADANAIKRYFGL